MSTIYKAVSGILFLAPLAHANLTSQSASFDLMFENSGQGDVLLQGFNPALGTLNSVQFLLNFSMTSSTNADNQTFMMVPPGIPVFTSAQANATAIATVMLNADGVPVFNAGPSANSTTILAPLQDAQIQTFITLTGNASVPQPFVHSFVTNGFAPVAFDLSQNVIINAIGIGSTNGQVILGPTLSDFSASLTAFYDYTPGNETPEPSTAITAAFMAIMWVIRRVSGVGPRPALRYHR